MDRGVWMGFGMIGLLSTAAPPVVGQPLAQAAAPVTAQSVQLDLPDVIELLLQHNRELKNTALDRIVQRQQLRQAESAFSPQFQPVLGLGISQTLSDATVGGAPLSASGFGGTTSGDSDRLAPGTVVTRSAQATGQLRTALGTSVTVTANPFQTQRLGVTVTQPLLRGLGQRVNHAPVRQAQLTEMRNQLELRKTLTAQITAVSVSYRGLARAQESLRIQRLSLESQRKELEFIQVLVTAGRRARTDLIDIQANISSTESQVLVAQNQLQQAKSDLLNLLDLQQSLDITVPQALIEEFQTGTLPVATYQSLNVDQLVQQAYANRPEYLQAQLDIQIAQLATIVAQDNQRWGLDLQATAGVGDTSEVAAGLTLSRVFGDRTLDTAQRQSEVDEQKRHNDLARIADDIKLEVGDRLRDINAALAQITAAHQASALAQQRLEIATEKFRRGRNVDIFQVLSLQNEVVTAQNAEVTAKINFLDAVSRLDEAIGATLVTWLPQVDASGLLN